MDLNALADFDAVVRHGGFGRASRVTGRPKATLSRRVMQLEQDLGVRLLQRAAGALVPTEEGALLYANVARLLGELRDLADAVSTHAERPAGRLRVSVPTQFAHEAVGRIAANFIARYPEVQLQVIGEDRFVDCIAEDYDVVIRANPAPDTNLAGRCFLRDALVMVAVPSLKKPPASGSEPVPVPAIVLLSAPPDDVWHVRGPRGGRAFRPLAVARFSSISMVYDAVLAGAGVAALPQRKVQEAIEDGMLVSWGEMSDRSVEVWALFATRRQLNPRIGAFVNFLSEHFAAEAALLARDTQTDVSVKPSAAASAAASAPASEGA